MKVHIYETLRDMVDSSPIITFINSQIDESKASGWAILCGGVSYCFPKETLLTVEEDSND